MCLIIEIEPETVSVDIAITLEPFTNVCLGLVKLNVSEAGLDGFLSSNCASLRQGTKTESGVKLTHSQFTTTKISTNCSMQSQVCQVSDKATYSEGRKNIRKPVREKYQTQ